MVKLIDGQYKIIGQGKEKKVVIDKFGNLRIDNLIYTFDDKNSSFKNGDQEIFTLRTLQPPRVFNIYSKVEGEEEETGILELIDEEKLNALDKKEKIKIILIYFSIFFVFILFFYTGLVNNNLISNKFLSNKIFKTTSKIFNLWKIFLISLSIPGFIYLNL